MKTKNIIAILVALPIMAGLTGCKSDDELTAKPAKEMLRVLGGDIEIRATDETTVVNVSADCHWKVQSLEAGDFGTALTVQPREGDGDGTLIIGTNQNETKADRTASFILVSDAGLRQKVTIRQTAAAGAINVSSASFQFNADGTSVKDITRTVETLTVRSNSSWQIQIPTGVSWVHLSKTSGGSSAQSSETIDITVDKAVNDATRSATLSIVSEGNTVEVQVSQEGMTSVYLKAQQELINFDRHDGFCELGVESNAEWQAYIPSSCTWLHFEESRDSTGAIRTGSGIGNGQLRVRCDANNTTRARLTAIVIIAGSKNPQQAVVLVEQASGDNPQPLQTSISLSELSVSRQSANFLINLTSEEEVGEFGLVYTREINRVPTINDGEVVVIGKGGTSRGLAYELTGLEENTEYMVRAFVRKINSQEVIYSEPIIIRTPISVVTVGELTSLYVANTWAEFRFGFTSDSDVIDYGFVYSVSNQMPTREDEVSTIGRGGTGGNVMGTIANLQENTTYYVRAYVLSQRGFTYSPNVVTITTAGPTEPGESDNPDPKLAPRR